MPAESNLPIPVGAKVYLLSFIHLGEKIKGTKIREGLFQADAFDSRLHNGGGTGPQGYFWYVQDSSLEQYTMERKKTGFAKFINKMENVNV